MRESGLVSTLSLRTLFRVAALLLLALIGADLVACELVSPNPCELSGAPCHDSHGCLCCCPHVVLAEPFVVEPVWEAVALAPASQPSSPSLPAASVYHPPKP